MVVKPNKQDSINVMILLLCTIAFDIGILIQGGTESLVFLCCCTAIMLTIVFRYAAAVLKIVEYSKTGCTVSFFLYSKTYPWEQLCVKRFEDYSCTYSYKRQFDEGVFFSVKPLRRPKHLGPCEVCMIKHPFTSFFVTFPSIGNPQGDLFYPAPYRVDKESFLNLMVQYRVVLDGIQLNEKR